MDNEFRVEAGEAVQVNPTRTSSCMGVSRHFYTFLQSRSAPSVEILKYISPRRGIYIYILKRDSYLVGHAIFKEHSPRAPFIAALRHTNDTVLNTGGKDDHTPVFLPGDTCIRVTQT